ncbi:hypothetical protein CJO94_00085 [Ralstonia solanacearum]|nr:hypothetical protein CJO94_00085 [Ralstonia solanacearum]
MYNAVFRQEVLQHLTALRARWPDGGLYLLYVPGEEDPLRLLGDQPRTQAMVRQALSGDTLMSKNANERHLHLGLAKRQRQHSVHAHRQWHLRRVHKRDRLRTLRHGAGNSNHPTAVKPWH